MQLTVVRAESAFFDKTILHTSGGQLHDIGVIIIALIRISCVNDVTQKESDIFLHFVDESVDNVKMSEILQS